MLTLILAVKIIATLLVWCIPLLFFPKDWFVAMGFPQTLRMEFLRLLGWAYLSLCVGYFFAWSASRRGIRQAGPLWVGVVSNGGAAALLLSYGLAGAWTQLGGFPQFVLWGSTGVAAALSLGIWFYGARHSSSTSSKG